MRELEAALTDIDAPVFARPGVDRAEPEPMQGADIVRGEAVVRSVVTASTCASSSACDSAVCISRTLVMPSKLRSTPPREPGSNSPSGLVAWYFLLTRYQFITGWIGDSGAAVGIRQARRRAFALIDARILASTFRGCES